MLLGSVAVKLILILMLTLMPSLLGMIYYNFNKEKENIINLNLEKAKILAETGAAAISKTMEDSIAAKELTLDQVFDTNYREIPNSNPKRYHTAYDDWTDKNIRKITEEYLKDPAVVFAIPVDKNGYLPTHNLNFSNGDFTDAANRTKRIFDDPTGIKAARNTEPYVQQEYKRDTGEIMWDVSAPIYIQGKHWGGFRIGYSMDKTYRDIAVIINRNIYFGIACTGLLIIIVVLAARFITHPLKKMETAVRFLAEGNLAEANVEHKSNDEIGRIINAFNSMRNSMRESLSKLMTEVKQKSGILSDTAGQLTSNAQQTTTSANENAVTTTEIAASAEEAASSLQSILTYAQSATEQASEGGQKIVKILDQIQIISKMSEKTSDIITELNEKSQEINRIVELITAIADQTNLLALNAAIEAARAGDHGRGFSVVAEEVRKLAEQSASAGKEIYRLINSIQSESQKAVQFTSESVKEIKSGVIAVQETGNKFNDIISAVQGLASKIQEVASTTEQLSYGVQNVAASTEEQTAAMEEVFALAESLSRLAEELNESVRGFKV